MPSKGGYVHPNGSAPGGGGAGAVKVHQSISFNVMGGDPEGIYQRIKTRLAADAGALLSGAHADVGFVPG
ncbi:hypothetical protein ACEN2J_14510 [Pseudorhodobacter sp. W20_MBD10_FR17]|uniref:hypothetical protein n=1 Tax=Pseudorhodobacter sp. W20_MBD10_FR17 TaxID=3240266 RepID=UPI003F9BA899